MTRAFLVFCRLAGSFAATLVIVQTMKLVRYRSTTGEKPGLMLDGEIYDLSAGFAALSHRAPTFEHVEAIAAVPVKTLQKMGKGAAARPAVARHRQDHRRGI